MSGTVRAAHRRVRRIAAMLTGLAAMSGALVAPALALAPAAHAADPQFRYWTYWTGTDEGWQFSPVGPAFRDAQDGVVEGWRLAVTGVTATIPPRVQPGVAFDAVCGGLPDDPDTVRVAIIIDFGTPADAPTGEQPPAALRTCVAVDNGSTGFDALRDVVDIRSERGLICGLAGYPRTGCAERVESAATDDSDAGGTRPEPADPGVADGGDAPDRDASDASAGTGADVREQDATTPPAPASDPASAAASGLSRPGPSGSVTPGTEVEAARAEAALAEGDGDPPAALGEPTYPAADRSATDGATTADAAAAGDSGGLLRSPWLVVPVLLLIAALGVTAWRRTRAARASGGAG